ncbi:hypothetical protein BJF83_21410 [Nocardiopsis sp. CNR-923]|uniref:DUF4192 domain-containing protein n=1 Tax=Nocardiopsis sp. CNR-923 TaxID=1904965 RepID=UPI0009597072|nr:DUF4192 domain-containing protein [Nocardiopsis sp. CNR-923]OLT26361.1 hypothetical protein BJF83_21410 [Nocardiopsis sp. CNR-923]
MDADQITVTSPNDTLAMMPYLVGTPPDPGLVVLTMKDHRVGSALCRDLHQTSTGGERLAEAAITHAVAEGSDACYVVGYGSGAQVTAYIDAITAAARRHGLTVVDALRVCDGRYWSYQCTDSGCCPPEGTPIDPHRSTLPAELVLRGLTPEPYRHPTTAPAARGLEPDASVRPEELTAATVEAEDAFLWDRAAQTVNDHGAAAVREAIDAALTGTGARGVTHLVRLAVALRDVQVRDAVWSAITPETARTHLDLWSRVTRTAATGDRAAPASLVAVAAWQHEDLSLAQAALDVALTADPHYTMAQLVQQALIVGLPAEKLTEFLNRRR